TEGCYPTDDPKKPYCPPPYVIVTLATADYFGGTLDQDAESCEFAALLNVSTATFPVETYDYDSGAPKGDSKTTWQSWEGTLEFDKTLIDQKKEPECFNLDTAYFPSGDPVDTLNGMHIGLGLGE